MVPIEIGSNHKNRNNESLHRAALVPISTDCGINIQTFLAAGHQGRYHSHIASLCLEIQTSGVTAAQMNLFYCLAVIAIDGDPGINEFIESRLDDARVLELVARM